MRIPTAPATTATRTTRTIPVASSAEKSGNIRQKVPMQKIRKAGLENPQRWTKMIVSRPDSLKMISLGLLLFVCVIYEYFDIFPPPTSIIWI